MAVDTLIASREIKSLRAEVAALKNEFVKMQKIFQDVQEQYGYAFIEMTNLMRTLSGEIKENMEKNQISLQDENFQNILGLSKKIDDVKKGLTENLSQALLNVQAEQKNFFANNFSQLEKIFDAQQINFGNHFDAIENSVAAQQKIFEEIFSQKNSEVIEKISVVQKNIKKFSSEVDEILSKNQKTLTKNFDGAKKQRKDIYKLLGSLEELLRLIAANQLLNEVENNLPTKNNSSQKISSSGKKKIYIYGRGRAGKTTLADILKRRMDNIEITESWAINRYNVSENPNADKIIYIIDESEPNSTEIRQFIALSRNVEKILLVVNTTAKFPNSRDREIFSDFQYAVGYSKVEWSKIYVVCVYLQGAKHSWTNYDYGSFERSNFKDIEEFIHS